MYQTLNKMQHKVIRVFIIMSTLLFSCKTEEQNIIQKEAFYTPEGFPDPVYQGEGYNFNQTRIDLGKKLFYDPILSIDNSISCGNCHAQSHAFADHNTAMSTGVYNFIGNRNSPALINLAWNTSFMHDGGVNHIEVFPLAPITNPVEMANNMENLMDTLNQDSIYRQLFKLAFDTDSISSEQMFISIAQFQSTLISANSKYDKVMRGDLAFNNSEERGYELFNTHCQSCHIPPLFTDYSFVNNGLDWTFTDPGRALISQNSADSGKFKVPTLRNVKLTNPYMHDGRFMNLEEVLSHYTEGVKNNGYLDDRLTTNVSLSNQDKEDLINFLEALTDYDFIANPDFAE